MNTAQSTKIASKLLAVRLLGKRIPVVVGWDITHRCNLTCSYCGRMSIRFDELSRDEALNLVDQMADAGVEVVAISGGEALVRDDIEDIVARLREKEIYISLNTNGSLIYKRKDAISYFNVIKVTIDGPRETTDTNRGKGSFDRAIQGYLIAKELVRKVMIGVVLSSSNVGRIDDIFDLIHNLGAKASFQPVSIAHSFGKDISRLIPDKDSYRSCIDRIITEKKQSNVVSNSIAALRYLRKYPDTPPIRCFAGLGMCRVAPDGQVYPCVIMGGEVRRWVKFQDEGFLEGFRKIPKMGCGQCWCSNALDFNLLLAPNPLAFISFIKERW